MKDKEKQIVELMKDKEFVKLVKLIDNTHPFYVETIALRVYEKYQPKLKDSVVLSKAEKEKLLKGMYEQGKFDALADLEKEGKVMLSKEEYNEYIELRNSEVAELVEENKALGKQCLDWMKLYHNQLNKTKEASKETAEKFVKEVDDCMQSSDLSRIMAYRIKQLAKQLGAEI